jgi:hypothetical protein
VERSDGEADAKQAAAPRSEIAQKFNSGRRSRARPPGNVVIEGPIWIRLY